MVEKKSEKIGEGLGISGFTLGVLSIALAGWIGIIIGIVGLIFSVVSQKNNPNKLARWGVVLNIVGLILSVVLIILFIKYLPIIESQLQ